MTPRALVYLHGFASSARSSKAAWLAERAREAGLDFDAPDLNGPEFSTLTITRMVDDTRRLLAARPAGPVTLVGSSLGALVAIFTALAPPAGRGPDSLVLMAPAVDLVPGLARHFGPERMQAWERTNRLEVFHYADGRMRTLEWGFYADARGYDPWAVELPVPTLVFQGTHDDTVDAAVVRRWADARRQVTLRMVDDGHQLLGSLDVMWTEMQRFMPAAPVPAPGPADRGGVDDA